MRGWLTCLTSLITMPASLYLIHIAPAWLLPLAWFISGTAFTGWFVIGHDCGHRSFNTNKLVEDIVGNFFFAPLLYPFEPWRIKHNQHHQYTNKLEDDTAWHPVMKEEVADMNKAGVIGALHRIHYYAVTCVHDSTMHVRAIYKRTDQPGLQPFRSSSEVVMTILSVASQSAGDPV